MELNRADEHHPTTKTVRYTTSSRSSFRRSENDTGFSKAIGSSGEGQDAGVTTLSPVTWGRLRYVHLPPVISYTIHLRGSRDEPLPVFGALTLQLPTHAVPEPAIELCVRVDAEDPEDYRWIFRINALNGELKFTDLVVPPGDHY